MSIYIGGRLLSGSSAVGGEVGRVTNITSTDGTEAVQVAADGTVTIPNGTIGSVTEQNADSTITTIQFWSGTMAQYDAIATKDLGTIYYVTDA